MVINIDLHIHTMFSGDSMITPKLVIERLRNHQFVKGVAITDHDTILGFKKTRELAKPYTDITIVSGIEVTTLQGHLVILGVEEEPKRPLTAWEAVDFSREWGGVLVIPHPFRPASGIGDLSERVPADAIEVINPSANDFENRLAMELAKRRQLPAVAGSDSHRLNELFAAYTKVLSKPTTEEVLKAIKDGKVRPKRLGGNFKKTQKQKFKFSF